MAFDLSDYQLVEDRLAQFFAKHDDGSLQSEIVEFTESRVTVKAYAYRWAGDERPGVGLASLAIPGSTPYTKGSELENAETSARGRALVAVGFGAKASREEVQKSAPARPDPTPPVAGAAATADALPKAAAPTNPAERAQAAQAQTGHAAEAGDTIVPLGKHKGKTLREAGDGYARWVVDKFEAKTTEQELFVTACRRYLGLADEPEFAGAGLYDDSEIPF